MIVMGHGAVFLLVRLLPGHVRESQRTCHVVSMPVADVVPQRLTALCGLVIERGTAEVVKRGEGMPCVNCLLRAPR